ncbi:MAG: sulfur oxidation c-type cytochrome SoxA [Cocleimonas sp.]
MNKLFTSFALLAIAFSSFITTVNAGTPAEDTQALRGYFQKTLGSKANLDEFINGTYALNEDARSQWEEIEEFPPYEIAIDDGSDIWDKEFKNGKSFASCFGDDISSIRGKYPYHDEAKDTVVTLEGDINKCLKDNGEKPFKWKKGKIAAVSAFIAYEGRGGKIDVQPKTEKALAWYNKGKNFFYAKRGQLNMSCAGCHVYNANNQVRAEPLSPALGHVSHFPVFRSKWGELGTLHRRYGGCNKQVRAKPFKAQSDQYKALEYFQAVMSNGLVLNGPGARK